jgi:hypothetical protein
MSRRRRRPLPVLPRGTPPERGETELRTHLITCPRISPQWRLAAQLALVKPKPYTKSAVGGRDPRQAWSRDARVIIQEIVAAAPPGSAALSFPARGAEHAIIEIVAKPGNVRCFVRNVSRRLPALWFTMTPAWYVHAGEFYAARGKYKLELVRTTHTRLRRAIRFGFLGDVDNAIAPARD